MFVLAYRPIENCIATLTLRCDYRTVHIDVYEYFRCRNSMHAIIEIIDEMGCVYEFALFSMR